MNMLQRIGNFFGKAAQATVGAFAQSLPLVPRFFEHLRWYINNRFFSYIREGYQHNAVVYRCINLLASSIGESPLKVYKRDAKGRKVWVQDHPLQALLDRPNKFMTQFEFIELMMVHLSAVGTSWWWKETNNHLEPIALWPLRGDRVFPRYGLDQEPLESWSYYIPGYDYREIPPERIFFAHYPDPMGETGGLFEGLGPLQVASREVDTDNVMTGFTFALLDNYAMPGVVATTEKMIDQDDADRFKQQWREKYGRMKRGDIALVDSAMKIETMSFNPRQLEMSDSRGSTECRICASFGVPSILVGVKGGLENATYSNMEQARGHFAETTCMAIWKRIEDIINLQLVPQFDSSDAIFVEFDKTRVKALQEAFAKQAGIVEQGFQKGAVTINEYRELNLSLEPVDGGDVFILPQGVTVIPADSLDLYAQASLKPAPKPPQQALGAGDMTLDEPIEGKNPGRIPPPDQKVPGEKALIPVWAMDYSADAMASGRKMLSP